MSGFSSLGTGQPKEQTGQRSPVENFPSSQMATTALHLSHSLTGLLPGSQPQTQRKQDACCRGGHPPARSLRALPRMLCLQQLGAPSLSNLGLSPPGKLAAPPACSPRALEPQAIVAGQQSQSNPSKNEVKDRTNQPTTRLLKSNYFVCLKKMLEEKQRGHQQVTSRQSSVPAQVAANMGHQWPPCASWSSLGTCRIHPAWPPLGHASLNSQLPRDQPTWPGQLLGP